MDYDAVADAFVKHYYNVFDTNRSQLFTLYQNESMLTFEGEKMQGPQNIQAKLSGLPGVTKHAVTTVDCQPSGPSGGLVVFVSGSLRADDDQPLRFSQMFHLMPTQNGSFYVYNDIFRLNYG
eukprot:TRINITY_DN883_c0_g1_i1.p1 TRINITY_DN883_c0_g1~~TRINITY_DN883_c0_g1_i1.p1  ORF type:complete len:122 (-),score=16.01 TRINITY_DN883_c0_g1_i1:268-633(-)